MSSWEDAQSSARPSSRAGREQGEQGEGAAKTQQRSPDGQSSVNPASRQTPGCTALPRLHGAPARTSPKSLSRSVWRPPRVAPLAAIVAAAVSSQGNAAATAAGATGLWRALQQLRPLRLHPWGACGEPGMRAVTGAQPRSGANSEQSCLALWLPGRQAGQQHRCWTRLNATDSAANWVEGARLVHGPTGPTGCSGRRLPGRALARVTPSCRTSACQAPGPPRDLYRPLSPPAPQPPPPAPWLALQRLRARPERSHAAHAAAMAAARVAPPATAAVSGPRLAAA